MSLGLIGPAAPAKHKALTSRRLTSAAPVSICTRFQRFNRPALVSSSSSASLHYLIPHARVVRPPLASPSLQSPPLPLLSSPRRHKEPLRDSLIANTTLPSGTTTCSAILDGIISLPIARVLWLHALSGIQAASPPALVQRLSLLSPIPNQLGRPQFNNQA